MEGASELGHPRGEAGDGGADELSQGNKQLLVGPERGLGGQIGDPMEEAGSLTG